MRWTRRRCGAGLAFSLPSAPSLSHPAPWPLGPAPSPRRCIHLCPSISPRLPISRRGAPLLAVTLSLPHPFPASLPLTPSPCACAGGDGGGVILCQLGMDSERVSARSGAALDSTCINHARAKGIDDAGFPLCCHCCCCDDVVDDDDESLTTTTTTTTMMMMAAAAAAAAAAQRARGGGTQVPVYLRRGAAPPRLQPRMPPGGPGRLGRRRPSRRGRTQPCSRRGGDGVPEDVAAVPSPGRRGGARARRVLRGRARGGACRVPWGLHRCRVKRRRGGDCDGWEREIRLPP